MSIQHHPSDRLLTAYAAGTLDLGQHVVVATHLKTCAQCRSWVRLMEHAGGALLADLAPMAMANDAFACVEARLDEAAPLTKEAAPQASKPLMDERNEQTVPEADALPAFVGSYPTGPWKWFAPRMYLAPIQLPEASETRVFLLRAEPGTKLLNHSHSGAEMTCVLRGSFSHDGGRFALGDFDFGDSNTTHRVFVESEGDCICLIAMQGELRLSGFIGFIAQPFFQM
jgi:putative transcriptional regulator